jgi:hypothetical protein
MLSGNSLNEFLVTPLDDKDGKVPQYRVASIAACGHEAPATQYPMNPEAKVLENVTEPSLQHQEQKERRTVIQCKGVATATKVQTQVPSIP